MSAMTFKIGFANDRQLKTFLKLLRVMQHCGDIGHSTSFNVGVDGDGAFKMDVEILGEGDEKTNYIIYSGLSTVVRKVVKEFMYGLASDAVLDTIMYRIREELVELDYNTDQFHDFPGTGVSGAIKSVKVVGLPIYETGVSGSVVVVTFEF